MKNDLTVAFGMVITFSLGVFAANLENGDTEPTDCTERCYKLNERCEQYYKEVLRERYIEAYIFGYRSSCSDLDYNPTDDEITDAMIRDLEGYLKTDKKHSSI